MNLNVQQAGGSVLVVSQFTLAADTQKGMRPVARSRQKPSVFNDYFSDPAVHRALPALINDGPVTFWLQV